MQKYRDFFAQRITTLSKFDEYLGDYFERIMNQNLMLNLDESALNKCPITLALRVDYFHVVGAPNFCEEKRYG
jgi:hypothetical protein